MPRIKQRRHRLAGRGDVPARAFQSRSDQVSSHCLLKMGMSRVGRQDLPQFGRSKRPNGSVETVSKARKPAVDALFALRAPSLGNLHCLAALALCPYLISFLPLRSLSAPHFGRGASAASADPADRNRAEHHDGLRSRRGCGPAVNVSS